MSWSTCRVSAKILEGCSDWGGVGWIVKKHTLGHKGITLFLFYFFVLIDVIFFFPYNLTFCI